MQSAVLVVLLLSGLHDTVVGNAGIHGVAAEPFSDIYPSVQKANNILLSDVEYVQSLPTVLKVRNRTERQATDDPRWKTAVERGNDLVCLMDASIEAADIIMASSDKGPSQSTYRWADLATAGWERDDEFPEGWRPQEYLPPQDILDALGITAEMPEDGGSVHYVMWTHEGVWRDASGEHTGLPGEYEQTYDPVQGVIYAESNQRPDIGVGLNQWSDVAFLEWEHQGNVKNLRYVFRLNTVNLDTRFVMEECLRRRGIITGAFDRQNPPDLTWGHQAAFEATSEEGRALLGTPNVYGVAWMLINHKAQMDIKRINRLSIWNEKRAALSLLLEIGPVPDS